MSAVPRTLTIAGSDSGGGAGIQADLKTFLALQTYGLSVVTALTAQNTKGVQGVHAPSAAFVRQQFESVASDIRIDGVKIGMLANTEIVREVARFLGEWKKGRTAPIVLDPVMVSTSGSLLLSHDAVAGLIHDLFPLCNVLTPNLLEAEQILKHAGQEPSKERGLVQMVRAARDIAQLSAANVLVKGGHCVIAQHELDDALKQLGFQGIVLGTEAEDANAFRATDTPCHRDAHGLAALSTRTERTELGDMAQILGASVFQQENLDLLLVRDPRDVRVLRRSAPDEPDLYTVDVLYEAASQRTTLFAKRNIPTSATHGTGCTLSSAICAAHTHDTCLRRAVAHAIQFMQEALQSSIEDLGQGPGPLNHGAHTEPRGVPLRTPRCATPLSTRLIARSWPLWHLYTRHPFAVRMSEGHLSKAAFVWFMRQDYIYLKHYARVWSAAAADPTSSLEDIGDYLSIAKATVDETAMHVKLCERAGISKAELESTEESRATMAYTRYVMDVSHEGILPLLVSLASCAYGYAEVGLWLKEHRQRSQIAAGSIDPSFEMWVEEYGGDAFLEAVTSTISMLERCAARLMPSASEVDHLQEIWNTYVVLLTQRDATRDRHVGRGRCARRTPVQLTAIEL